MLEEEFDGLSFEAWIQYDGDQNIGGSKGWLMTTETGWGPAICINDLRFNNENNTAMSSRSIATTPGGNTFKKNQPNPGPITYYKKQILHLVGWWKNNTHGIYVNRIHYRQKNGNPSLGNAGLFTVGNWRNGDGNHNCKGVKIFSFRVWHTKLTQNDVNKLYSFGKHGMVHKNIE